MNLSEMKQLLKTEIEKNENFKNWHGISSQNLSRHLVEPYQVTVYSDEENSDPEKMWVILHEYPNENEKGYLIGYCPSLNEWCLIEKLKSGKYLCDITGEPSLAEALTNM